MSDDYNVSYSYQTGPLGSPDPAAPTPEPASELYAFAICDRIDLDSNSVLLLNRSNGIQLAIRPEVATALTYCANFKTLEEHARLLVSTIPQLQGQFDDVSRVLIMVRDAGLMYTASDICAQLQPKDAPARVLAPTRVCIITCDRPAAIERLLDSMLHAGNLSHHDEMFLVDDSRESGNREKNRALVTRFNLTSQRDVRYVGVNAQDRLISELIASLPQHEAAIRFLVDRERWTGKKTYGLARTLCLLLTAGYRCIVLDDDTLCTAVSPPQREEGLSFGGGDSRELACFGSEAELMQNAVFESFDPICGHAQCLGMGIGQALEELGIGAMAPAALENNNAALLTTLHRSSPILITQCGSWGDPGTGSGNWWCQLSQDSLTQAISSAGGLDGAMKNRHYWFGRSVPNIAKMAVMSQTTGLDNSQLLPPYFPAFRGEDYLFASMVACMHPASAVLDYAWSVPHLPLEDRAGRAATEVSVAQASLAICARYLSDLANFDAGPSAETKLHVLTAHIRELSEREPTSLLATLRKELTKQRAEQLEIMQKQLQTAPKLGSPAWEEYLKRGIEKVGNALQLPAQPSHTSEAGANVDEAMLLQHFQGALEEFASALEGWPAIRAAAGQATTRLINEQELMP